MYIDGSFVKHKIPVKPIYVTVRNLNSVVSGKSCAWRVLGMIPSVRKSATLQQDDTWSSKSMSPRMLYHKLCLTTSMRWNVLPWQIEIIICLVRLASDIRPCSS